LNLNLITVLPSRSSAASKLIKIGLGDQVQLDRCIYREQFNEPASSYIIKSQNTGSRTIVNHNELPDMTLQEFIIAVENLRKVSGQPWFHFEVCSVYTGLSSLDLDRPHSVLTIRKGRMPDVTTECIKYIRDHFPGARISVEVEKPGRPGLQELAGTADVVFYSKGWAQVRTFVWGVFKRTSNVQAEQRLYFRPGMFETAIIESMPSVSCNFVYMDVF
jgi:ketohexokinase